MSSTSFAEPYIEVDRQQKMRASKSQKGEASTQDMGTDEPGSRPPSYRSTISTIKSSKNQKGEANMQEIGSSRPESRPPSYRSTATTTTRGLGSGLNVGDATEERNKRQPNHVPWYKRLRPGIPRMKTKLMKLCGLTILCLLLTVYAVPTDHAVWTSVGITAHQLPDPDGSRYHHALDTFQGYKFRNTCKISSMDLHSPSNHLCTNSKNLLTAMSSGGRIGFDAPYTPRGCDMRWFSTEEICEILGRFDRVVFIGDSMMRHISGSINIFTRMDLGHGAVTDWNFSPSEREMCFCNKQFDAKRCSVQGIYKTSDVLKHDPKSFTCTAVSINVLTELIIRYPIPDRELQQLRDTIGNSKTKKPVAFVLGHGLWNDLDLQKTVDWTDKIMDTIKEQLPHLAKPYALFPRLFVTPNASGKQKPDQWLSSQGNKALMLFEEAMGIEAAKRGIEHLGTWNMSIQATKYDGVHLDLRGNLVKGMMVLNWLNMLDV